MAGTEDKNIFDTTTASPTSEQEYKESTGRLVDEKTGLQKFDTLMASFFQTTQRGMTPGMGVLSNVSEKRRNLEIPGPGEASYETQKTQREGQAPKSKEDLESLIMFENGGAEGTLDFTKDPEYQKLLKYFGADRIKTLKAVHDARAYAELMTAYNTIADQFTQTASKLLDPSGKLILSEEEKQARFKPQVSRRALDEMKARGPMQRETPDFQTSYSAILANVVTSALGGVFKQIGMGGASDRKEALATTQAPPELLAMLQSSEMIRSDIAKYDDKVAKIEDLNFELQVKHQYAIDAMEAEFDARSDAADLQYKNALENHIRYTEARYDKFNNLAAQYKTLSKKTAVDADMYKAGLERFNIGLERDKDKFNAMANFRAKQMAYAKLSADRAKRKSGSVMDTKRFMNTTYKAAEKTTNGLKIQQSGISAMNAAGRVINWSSSNMQYATNNNKELINKYRQLLGTDPKAAENFFDNVSVLLSNGIDVPANSELMNMLSNNQFSLVNKLSEQKISTSDGRLLENLGVIMRDEEGGRSLIDLLVKVGSIHETTGEGGAMQGKKVYASYSGNQDRARITAMPFVESGALLYIGAAEQLERDKNAGLFSSSGNIVESAATQ